VKNGTQSSLGILTKQRSQLATRKSIQVQEVTVGVTVRRLSATSSLAKVVHTVTTASLTHCGAPAFRGSVDHRQK
jgi:hypothetical protein